MKDLRTVDELLSEAKNDQGERRQALDLVDSLECGYDDEFIQDCLWAIQRGQTEEEMRSRSSIERNKVGWGMSDARNYKKLEAAYIDFNMFTRKILPTAKALIKRYIGQVLSHYGGFEGMKTSRARNRDVAKGDYVKELDKFPDEEE